MGSVGVPIINSQLTLDPLNQELIFQSKSVMLGYARDKDDLAKGDECCGVLYTGDFGYQDSDDFFYLNGRKNRLIKLFGTRINLDDLEKTLEKKISAQVVCIGNETMLHTFIDDEQHLTEIKKVMMDLLQMNPKALSVSCVQNWPTLPSGKIDYERLQKAHTF